MGELAERVPSDSQWRVFCLNFGSAGQDKVSKRGVRLGAARSSEQDGMLRHWVCRTWVRTWTVTTRSPDEACWPGWDLEQKDVRLFTLRDPSLAGLRGKISQEQLGQGSHTVSKGWSPNVRMGVWWMNKI